MSNLWGTIEMSRWQQTPHLSGRIAGEQDVKDGRAVFYLQGVEPAVHVDIGLPHCAILSADGQFAPVVIIQSERAGEKHYVGYRPVSGGNGICLISEVQLLKEPDERFCG